MEEEEKIMFCLNCFRTYSKEAIQEKVHTLLIFRAFHYFCFLMTYPNPLSEFFRAEGGEQKHFKAEAAKDCIEKRKHQPFQNLELCTQTWTVSVVLIF